MNTGGILNRVFFTVYRRNLCCKVVKLELERVSNYIDIPSLPPSLISNLNYILTIAIEQKKKYIQVGQMVMSLIFRIKLKHTLKYVNMQVLDK